MTSLRFKKSETRMDLLVFPGEKLHTFMSSLSYCLPVTSDTFLSTGPNSRPPTVSLCYSQKTENKMIFSSSQASWYERSFRKFTSLWYHFQPAYIHLHRYGRYNDFLEAISLSALNCIKKIQHFKNTEQFVSRNLFVIRLIIIIEICNLSTQIPISMRNKK